jgi:hypothetical protein
MASSDTYDQVLVQLSPYVGKQMARAILNLHCQSMGLQPAELDSQDLGPLANRLQTALKAFLGGARASALVTSIARQN